MRECFRGGTWRLRVCHDLLFGELEQRPRKFDEGQFCRSPFAVAHAPADRKFELASGSHFKDMLTASWPNSVYPLNDAVRREWLRDISTLLHFTPARLTTLFRA